MSRGTPIVRIASGPDRGRLWTVDGPCTIGREGDLALTDPAVSRRHLALEPTATGVRVTDLGSAGGTYLDGTRVSVPVEMAPGGTATLGSTVLMVHRLARYRPLGAGPSLVVQSNAGVQTIVVSNGLTLGRDPSCDVVVPAGEVSRVHASIRWDGSTLGIEDRGSSNGTFVNDRLIDRPAVLVGGDRIDLGRSPVRIEVVDQGEAGRSVMARVSVEGTAATRVRTIETGSGASVAEVAAALVAASEADQTRPWTMCLPDRAVLLHPDDEWAAVAVERGERLALVEGDVSELVLPVAFEQAEGSDRRANQLPRSKFPPSPYTVTRPRAPESTSFRGRGTIWQVVGGVGAVIVGLGMAILGGRQYALFGIMAGLIGVVTVGASIASDQSRRRHGLGEYRQRIGAVAMELAAETARQTAVSRDLAPDDDELADRIERASSRLWERRPGDPDALHLRIGTGRRQMLVEHGRGRDDDSPYEAELDEILNRYRWLDDVPVCAPGAEVGSIGICGDPARVRRLVNRMVVEAAAVHAPRQLAIWVASSAPRWEWARWLPHGGSAATAARVSDSAPSAQGLLTEVRSHVDGDIVSGDERQLVVVDLDRRGGSVEDLGRLLVGRGLVLVVSADRRDLPNGLGSVIELGAEGDAGMLGGGVDGPEGRFETLGLEAGAAERLAIRLGGLVDQADTVGGGGLLEILGLGDIEHLDVGAAWAASRPDPLTVAIGVDDSGDPVTIGFRRDGPHGMVAGTTGSGKSELLQSLLVALAVTHPPSELELFLIDFKGGATFAPLARLPHVAGLVTDLEADGALATRAFTALDAEMERRKRLLERAGVANVVEHARLPASRREPLPNLLVVIDEFALLVERQPEVKERLDTVTTQGRSLGVHLLLATQSPSGVITHAIRTNTNLWICLRVVSDAESMELIGSRDAARLPDKSPGRGFVRLGAGDERRPLRTARIARPVGGTAAAVTVKDGEGVRLYQGPGEEEPDDGATTEMDVVVDAVVTTASRQEIASARPLWLPPLPAVLRPDQIGSVERRPDHLVAVLGLVDRPEEQAQDPYLIDLTASGHALVSGLLGFGKSTTLLQIGVDLAAHHPPSALHLYGIEAGGGELAPLTSLPHTGAVVGVGDVERLMRLLARLTATVDRRRAAIADAGAGNFVRWRASGGNEPWVVLLVDDYASFKEAAEQIELGRPVDLFNSLLQNGPAVGIHIVVAVSQAGDLRLSQTSLIPVRVLFRQSEAGEYSLLELRLRPSEVPVSPPGRAMVAGGASVQVCRPDVDGLPSVAARWAHDPVAARPRPIDRMPTTVERSSIPSSVGGANLLVGVGGPELEPVDLAFGPGAAALVAGPLRSGRSTALRTLLESAVATDPDLRCTVLAPRPSPLRDLASHPNVTQILTDSAGVSEALETILEDAHAMLVVDDAESLAGGFGVTERLEEVVRRAGEHGTRVLVGARVNDLPGMYDPWIRYLVSLRRVVLLQPTADDAFVFGAKLPVIPNPATPGRGVLVDGHRVVVLQVAVPADVGRRDSEVALQHRSSGVVHDPSTTERADEPTPEELPR